MGVKKGSTDRVNSMPDCPRDSTLECNMQMRGVVFVGGEEAYRAAASTPLAAIEKVFDYFNLRDPAILMIADCSRVKLQ